MCNKQSYLSGIIVSIVALAMFVVVGTAGCGGGSPAGGGESASVAGQMSISQYPVGPASGGDQAGPGDMDADQLPTANDAQLIMGVVVGPDDAYSVVADADYNSAVEVGDALKVLRAAAGEIDWPFDWPAGPPPPPPI